MRLDLRSPFVLSVADLARRPGTMRTRTLSLPAPADLRLELVGVPAGSPVDLDLRLESVMEGVLVTGTADVEIRGECARCLGDLDDSVTVDIQELYVYPESDAGPDEAARLDGELLDLEPAVRDAVVLALPFRPVCRDDCPGLCAECGARLADDPEHRHDETVDPRWAVLTAFAASPPGATPAGTDDDKEQ